jgi:AraC-like DNA-binding protein
MTLAKELLTAGHQIASVANALGYSGPSAFCFAFHRNVGTTPGRFRKMLPKDWTADEKRSRVDQHTLA